MENNNLEKNNSGSEQTVINESDVLDDATENDIEVAESEITSFLPEPPYKRVKVKDFDSFMKKTKLYIKHLWGKMDMFCKITTILAIITLLLFIVAVVLVKTAPIIFSVFQIICLVVAFLMYKGIIPRIPSWIKFIVLGLVGLLMIVNIASYSWTDKDYSEATVYVNTPYSSEDCLGKNYSTVKNDLETAGFVNISEEIIEDVELTETDKNGMIESVSINGISDFSANDKFNSLAKVIIIYHSYKHLNAPVSSADAKTMEPTALLKAFSDAGFVNISTSEEFDLDPDTSSLDYENQVVINEDENFDTDTKIPINADIKIITHRAYEKYTLKLSIDFTANLIFSTYDVKMSIGEETKVLPHGEDAEFELRLKPGKYTLTFTSEDSYSVDGSVDLEIAGNTEASYKINCYSDRVEVTNLKNSNDYSNKTEETTKKTETTTKTPEVTLNENQAKVPASSFMLISEPVNEVVERLKTNGFTNIKTQPVYDIDHTSSWDSLHLNDVESVSINNKKDFSEGDVFEKNTAIIITYHLYEKDNPDNVYTKYTAAQLFKDLENNPIRAKDKHLNEFVEIKGKVEEISSDGSYILIYDVSDYFSFEYILCNTEGDEFKDFIYNLSVGDTVNVRGKIIRVDNIYEYTVNVYSFQ